jgi:hypothetical protein
MSEYKNKNLTADQHGLSVRHSDILSVSVRVVCGFLNRTFSHNSLLAAFFFLLMCASAAIPAAAEDLREDRWYISNAAGMALKPAFSRLALREKYALLVTEILPGDLPGNLREYYNRLYRETWFASGPSASERTGSGGEDAGDAPFSLRLEKRILYKDRAASRLQWLFLDGGNLIRLAAAFAVDPAEYPPPEIPAGEADGEPGAPDGGETDGAEAVEAVVAEAAPEGAGAAENDGDGDAGDGEAGENDEDAGDSEGEKPAVDYSGYIEVYDGEGYIVEEQLYSSDSSGRTVNYFYNGRRLIRAVTKVFGPVNGTAESRVEDYCSDNYRYSRSSSLRGVERIYHARADAGPPAVTAAGTEPPIEVEAGTETGPETEPQAGAGIETEAEPVRLRFPHVVLGAAKNAQFVSPAVSFSNEFFMDILVDSGSRVLYTTDERGRVLTETRRDEDGEVLGELRNTWSGDRLVSIHWKAGDDERITEFEYNGDGDRILERNINRGVLEREVSIEKSGSGDGDRETELLYIDGKPMLKAVWENGRKVSEERIRSQASDGAAQPQPALDGDVQPQASDGAGF